MDEDFEKLLKEYDLKNKHLSELNNELAVLLKTMSEILIKKHENIIQLEALMKAHQVNITDDVINFNVGGTLFSIYKSDLVKKIQKPFQRDRKRKFIFRLEFICFLNIDMSSIPKCSL